MKMKKINFNNVKDIMSKLNFILAEFGKEYDKLEKRVIDLEKDVEFLKGELLQIKEDNFNGN